MRRSAKFFLLFLLVGSMFASAQTPSKAAANSKATPSSNHVIDNPVANVVNRGAWEYGPVVNWGSGVANRSDYKFFWAGFQLGKRLTPMINAGIFSGQFELAGSINPLWLGFTPPPHQKTFYYNGQGYVAPEGGGTFHGVMLKPVIMRWNFKTRRHRFEPWFQAAGGLLYTTHKYPPDQLVPQGTPGGTSVWNFMPQGGIGFHYFLSPRRSVDLGVNAVHISSASLGDKNPGVNASIQIEVGYTFWRWKK